MFILALAAKCTESLKISHTAAPSCVSAFLCLICNSINELPNLKTSFSFSEKTRVHDYVGKSLSCLDSLIEEFLSCFCR